MTARGSAEDLCELHWEAYNLSLCTQMCLHTLAVSSTGIPKRPLPTPQSPWPPRSAGSEGETGEKSTQSTVVAPEPASGGVWFLSEYAISVRKAKAVLPVHHCTAKLAALDPLLSVKTW